MLALFLWSLKKTSESEMIAFDSKEEIHGARKWDESAIPTNSKTTLPQSPKASRIAKKKIALLEF